MWQKIFEVNFSKWEDVEKTLDEMQAITKSLKSFQESIEDDDTYEWRFSPLDENPPFKVDDEGLTNYIYVKEVGLNVKEDTYYFVKQAIAFGFQEKLEKVIQNIGNIQKELKSVWVDTEVIFGSEYGAILAVLDIKYLSRYTWFIKQLYIDDLDHEILQCEVVEALLDKHGYCDETVNHMIELAALTQAGNETMMIRSQSDDFAKYLKENGKLDWFKSRLDKSKIDKEDQQFILDQIESNLAAG